MANKVFEVVEGRGSGGSLRWAILFAVVLVLLLIGNPVHGRFRRATWVSRIFFGNVSSSILTSGVHFVLPFTKVVKMSIKTQEIKETAEVPSKEGLIMDLEASVLYRLDPTKAPEIYRTIGRDYASDRGPAPDPVGAARDHGLLRGQGPLFVRSGKRSPTRSYDLVNKMSGGRGIITEAVLLRKIGLPALVANAIQEKLSASRRPSR